MNIQDVIVIGAGQAGLGASYFLQQKEIQHIVFEQGRIGETWLSQRWDTFKLNTLNKMNGLPGLPYDESEPDGFWGHHEQVNYFQKYVETFKLPVRSNVTVSTVERTKDNTAFIINTNKNGQDEIYTCRSVIAACGVQRVPKIPVINSKLPKHIHQIHTSDYRNADALPPGAVLVIGSGQSGVQVVEDLLNKGRSVYLCTSKVGRFPRRHRGRDTMEWAIEMDFFNMTYIELPDKAMARASQPQVSGVGRYGHSVSLQYLAEKGAVILGRLEDVESDRMKIGDEAVAHVKFADEFSARFKSDIDKYLVKNKITPPPLEDDPGDIPDPEAKCASSLRELNLGDLNISTIIWATGFQGDFSWINLPILDAQGQLIHEQGVSPEHGLYFLGFPWLNSRKSGIIHGIEDDAKFIVDAIEKQLKDK